MWAVASRYYLCAFRFVRGRDPQPRRLHHANWGVFLITTRPHLPPNHRHIHVLLSQQWTAQAPAKGRN